jgi:hypothetical protein
MASFDNPSYFVDHLQISILNTLREKHQETISTFPEGWDKRIVIGKFQLHNEQVSVVSGYGTPNSRTYMVGIIFPSNNRQQQILCYTIGENNTELFSQTSDDRKLPITVLILTYQLFYFDP